MGKAWEDREWIYLQMLRSGYSLCAECSVWWDFLRTIFNILGVWYSVRARGAMIYFIQARQTGLIKIGVVRDERALVNRVATLKAEGADTLSLLGTRCGDHTAERELHKRLAQYCHHGEWFKPAPEVLDYIWRNTTDFYVMACSPYDEQNIAPPRVTSVLESLV